MQSCELAVLKALKGKQITLVNPKKTWTRACNFNLQTLFMPQILGHKYLIKVYVFAVVLVLFPE